MNQMMDERKKIWDDVAGANNYQIWKDGLEADPEGRRRPKVLSSAEGSAVCGRHNPSPITQDPYVTHHP